jgi:hypothetical protein
MNRITIGVWLSVALLGIVLYMLPTVMKQLFFVKEQFVARVEESKDAWKFERPTLDERFTNPQGPASDPMGFQIGGAGGNSLESQPAPLHDKQNGPTPSELQGMQMHKAPAHGVVEGYYSASGPSPAPAPGSSPSAASGAGPSAAPSASPSASLAPTCGYQYNPDPNGDPIYTCDGKIVTKPSGPTPALPIFLKSASTKDGIDPEEAAIMNYWLTNDNRDMPGWVKDLAAANTLTDSEKKAFATWAKENTKPSQEIIKPTAGTTASSSGSSSSGSSKCGKKSCKPKPTCSSPPVPAPATTCKGPIDMGDYIRKDSIPCWACTL